ncbi:MAG: NUDIX hydrolase [Alphaproteobacteria bacterium]|nr:NUDIX hydrolase [Alphaproteobacteria bacterium]
MSDSQRPRLSAFRDCAWRAVFRLGFALAGVWWRLTSPQHEGAVVAIHVGPALLLVRCSYRVGWHLPGGGVRRGEHPEAAARRELAEEIGLAVTELHLAGTACGIWDGRRDRVHFFELRLAELPKLRLDNREVVEAHLILPEELRKRALAGPLAAYLGRSLEKAGGAVCCKVC